ncbi:MAG: uroporphyrinogen decarboxylase family protein [Planctomycetes bacterium]|nr:uroporphyrinogen decarboxylase family protein [Planctomycetota bacterium]
MTGKQRALAAMWGQPHDRVPVVPIVGQAAAAWCGVPIREHSHDPELLARCQVDVARRFGYDGVYIAADTWVNAEACGFPHVEHPLDQPAGGHGTWIESPGQIDTLPLPDPQRSGRWPLMVEAVRYAVRLAADELLVIGNFDQSPFDLACQLRGINQFMLDLLDDPPFAHRLLGWCAEAVARYAIALGEAGAHVLNTGDSAASGSLIGPGYYEEFAWPYEKRVFDAVHRELDVPITLHICGDASTCLRLMAETGAAGLELDYQVDLRAARAVCGERVTIIGNVDPVDPLLRGTPDEVRAKCRECLAVFVDSDRFILASGCALSPLTPPANLAAMVEAVSGWP